MFRLDYRVNNERVHTRVEFFRDLFIAIGGSLLFALGMNLLIVPLKFYSGGFLGIAQLIRSFFRDFMSMGTEKFDIASIIYYILNIPLFVLAWRKLGRTFFYRTLLMSTLFTIFMLVIPIPRTPMITEPLTASIVAGVLCGYGAGYVLRAGYSAGGPDILGLYLIKYGNNFSVGKITTLINILVFGICAMMYNFETVVYSFIFNLAISMTVDRVHFQNIIVQVTIFSKNEGVKELILKSVNRGVTEWKGVGGYTGEVTNVYTTMVSKYEVEKLTSMVRAMDPNAFIISTEGTRVTGNFEKRL